MDSFIGLLVVWVAGVWMLGGLVWAIAPRERNDEREV